MATINYLYKVQFDFGARTLLGDELKLAGVTRPLVVTDGGLVAAGIVERVPDALPDDIAATVFDETPENPTEAAARTGAAMYAAAGCDAIVGVGGGSPMDEAKAIAILVANPPPLERYAYYTVGTATPLTAAPPTFLVPTTAGTGSEVGRAGIIILDNGRKVVVMAVPGSIRCALSDPELTLGLPPDLTAATGMDAMAHCIETFCSPAVNPPADAIALDGLARVASHIERAFADGSDRTARWHMLMGSMQGALCFQKGLGAVHAISHPLGAFGHHHGTLNAVLLPAVLAWNHDHIGAGKLAAMRRAMGLGDDANLSAHIAELNARLGLPGWLGAMGVADDGLDAIAAQSLEDPAHHGNPRLLAAADYVAIIRDAL